MVASAELHGRPAAARNAGAGKAQDEYLAFTDNDCTPTPERLKAFARASQQAPRALVGGSTTNALSDNIYVIASQVIVEAARGYFFNDAQRVPVLRVEQSGSSG